MAKTGAGDAFSAAYLVAREQNHDMETALRWGTANACSVVGRHGPQAGLLSEPDIKKYINQFTKIQPQNVG